MKLSLIYIQTLGVKMKIKVATEQDVVNRMLNSPEKYFIGGEPCAKELVARLLKEAVYDGALNVNAKYDNGWWHVTSDSAWFLDCEVGDYFKHALKFDVGAAGGMRCGLVISTFSSDVSVFCPKQGAVTIKGEQAAYEDKPETTRISFRLTTA